MLLQPTTHLCHVFRILAERTWHDLSDAAKAGYSLGEESVTDYLLLDLKRRAPIEVIVSKFNRRDEGHTTGADWEWWFVQGGRGFGMRVQAKRLNPATQKYDTLDHTVRRTGRKQVNLLIGDAEAASPRLYPMYCFYNYIPPGGAQPLWRCRSRGPDVREFGCSVADAYSIRALLRRKRKQTDLGSIGALSFPWSCMVCCNGFAGSEASLPERVRAVAFAMSQLVAETESRARRERRLRSRPSVPEPVAELPVYVHHALQARERDGRGNAEREIPEPLRSRPIDGLLVVLAADER